MMTLAGFSTQHSEISVVYPITLAIISILFTAIINLYKDQRVKKACNNINKKHVEKFVFQKKNKRFQIRTWSNLYSGDIIKIKKNQEFPADCLILDVTGSQDHKCFVRGGLFNDVSMPALKKSYQGTQNKTGMKMTEKQFVQQISGLIKWEYNFKGYFTGTFKLNDNPAAFEFTNENIVQRGSYLYQTKQVTAMVLNVGD